MGEVCLFRRAEVVFGEIDQFNFPITTSVHVMSRHGRNDPYSNVFNVANSKNII